MLSTSGVQFAASLVSTFDFQGVTHGAVACTWQALRRRFDKDGRRIRLLHIYSYCVDLKANFRLPGVEIYQDTWSWVLGVFKRADDSIFYDTDMIQ